MKNKETYCMDCVHYFFDKRADNLMMVNSKRAHICTKDQIKTRDVVGVVHTSGELNCYNIHTKENCQYFIENTKTKYPGPP